MQDSADRLCIPRIPVEDYIQAVEALVDVDRDWVPHSEMCIRDSYHGGLLNSLPWSHPSEIVEKEFRSV